MTTSNLQFRSPAADLYSGILWSAWHADVRKYDPDYALNMDPWIYEKMDRSPFMAKLMNLRTTLVAGSRTTVVPADDKDPASRTVAGLCDAGLKFIRRFKESRKQLARADFRGQAWARMYGGIRKIRCPDGFVRQLWVPNLIDDVDKRRFELRRDPNTGETFWAFQALDAPYEWTRLEHPEWYARHTIDETEQTLGRGRGLAEPLYYINFVIEKLNKYGLSGAEKWAEGIVKVKLASYRPGATDKTNVDLLNATLTNIAKMRSRNVLVVGSDDEAEVFERTGEGHKIVMELIRHFEDQAEELVLGGTHSQGGGDETGYNKGDAHQQTRDIIIRDSGELLSEAISDSVLGLFLKVNRPVFEEMGLGEALDMAPPRFQIVYDRNLDPINAAQLIKAAMDTGMKVRVSDAHELTGIPMPAEGEDVLQPVQPPQSASMGFGFDLPGGGFGGNPASEAGAPDPMRDAVPAARRAFTAPAVPRVENHIHFDSGAIRVETPGVQVHNQPAAVHVNVEPPSVHVDVPPPTINVQPAANPAPIVNVAAPVIEPTPLQIHLPRQEPPVVRIAAPAAQPAPVVNVHVPPQAAPVVNVENRIDLPKPSPKKIEFKRDAQTGQIKGAEIKPE
jgi:hypothetical protein